MLIHLNDRVALKPVFPIEELKFTLMKGNHYETPNLSQRNLVISDVSGPVLRTSICPADSRPYSRPVRRLAGHH